MNVLEPAEAMLVEVAQRLASLCRRQGMGEVQVLLLAEADSARIANALMLAARTKALLPNSIATIPANLDKCRSFLPDELAQGIMDLLILLAIRSYAEPTMDYGVIAEGLAVTASSAFKRRGRYVLSSEVLRVAGRIMASSGLIRQADRLFIKSEDLLTEASPWSWSKLGRILVSWSSGYGYAPLRLASAAVILVILVSLSAMVVLHFPFLKAVSLAVGNYFTLGGAEEYFGLPRVDRILFAAEAAGALLINGFFLTLLTKRLFRA